MHSLVKRVAACAPGLQLAPPNCIYTELYIRSRTAWQSKRGPAGELGSTTDSAFRLKCKLPDLEISHYCQNVFFDFITRRKFSLHLE